LLYSYEKLGLLTSLNGQTGGKEKMMPDKKMEATEDSEPKELKELTDADIDEIKKSLGPGEGLIQRDDEGNVVRIIIGEERTHNDILDAEVAPVEAKTDVVRALEAQAANAHKNIKYQSEYELDWVQKLINKHGDDYKAMFWDKELNIYQQTAAQLKRKCEKHLKK
jgi:nucleolar protein 16